MTTTPLKAKTPIDLVAFASLALGFHPSESAVMLGVSGCSMHARIDLPTEHDDRDQFALALATPASQNGMTRAVFVFYTERDISLATEAWSAIDMRFTMAGIEVPEALIVHNGRWHAARDITQTGDADISGHPFILQAIVDGRLTRNSRDEIRESLAMRDTMDAALVPDMVLHEEVTAMLDDVVADHRIMTDHELGILCAGLTDGDVRDQIGRYTAIDRTRARFLQALYNDATARVPHEHRANVAAQFALAALMAGDGASSWIGVDVATRNNSLADLIATCLEQAINPERVQQMWLSATD